MPYQHYYNIGFLDDLHNYFPDILYGSSGRFRNVDELLEYIRSQTRERFDLFSNARNNFNQDRNLVRDVRSYPLTNEDLNSIHITINTEDILQPPSNPSNDMLSSLRNLVNLLYPPILQIPGRTSGRTFLEPVVVRPTQEQITNATSIIELPNNSEMCAICQYQMTDSQQIRRISYCRHSFHDTCINTHFTTNVRCPICRYDIRSS